MSRESEALKKFIDEHEIRVADMAEVFNYADCTFYSYISGKSTVPLKVLLAIGFYLPVQKEDVETVIEAKKLIQKAVEKRAQERENDKIAEQEELIRKWSRLNKMENKKGFPDIPKIAERFGVQPVTVRKWLYQYYKMPERIRETMKQEVYNNG